METIEATEQGNDRRDSAGDGIPSKSIMPRSRRARWHNDGPDDSVSSLSVLLDWLTAEGNYNKWRGGDKQSGETKAVLAAQISTLIHEKGITHFRKPKDIITKISQLEQSFRDAVDFLNNTGAGITNESSLQQAIEKRCPHYSILKDVLGDRPSTRPLVTSDDLALLNGAELELDFHEECNDQPAESTLSQEGEPKRGNSATELPGGPVQFALGALVSRARYLTGATSTQRCHAQRRWSKKASAKCMTRISC
ncbi:hypothetical protein GQ600_15049 [Phytophthora cactorum]|nr:hypothetical protein GQ600_15049 [Phytophthora cactorum]